MSTLRITYCTTNVIHVLFVRTGRCFKFGNYIALNKVVRGEWRNSEANGFTFNLRLFNVFQSR